MELPVAEAARRLALFCDAYGLAQRAGLIELIAARQRALHDTIAALAARGQPAFCAMWGTEHSRRPLRERDHLLAHREAFDRALS